MTSFLVRLEDDEERLALVVVDADSHEDAARRVRYLLDPAAARIVGTPIVSRLTPAMAETLA